MFGALDGKAASDWNMLLDAFRQLIEAVFTADSMSGEEADREEARLSDKVCHAFANMHSWPDVVFTPISHMYVHFARPIRIWGCVRNFWAFFNERFVGWITNFIADRARPTENIVDAYSGCTLLLPCIHFVVRVYFDLFSVYVLLLCVYLVVFNVYVLLFRVYAILFVYTLYIMVFTLYI